MGKLGWSLKTEMPLLNWLDSCNGYIWLKNPFWKYLLDICQKAPPHSSSHIGNGKGIHYLSAEMDKAETEKAIVSKIMWKSYYNAQNKLIWKIGYFFLWERVWVHTGSVLRGGSVQPRHSMVTASPYPLHSARAFQESNTFKIYDAAGEVCGRWFNVVFHMYNALLQYFTFREIMGNSWFFIVWHFSVTAVLVGFCLYFTAYTSLNSMSQ